MAKLKCCRQVFDSKALAEHTATHRKRNIVSEKCVPLKKRKICELTPPPHIKIEQPSPPLTQVNSQKFLFPFTPPSTPQPLRSSSAISPPPLSPFYSAQTSVQKEFLEVERQKNSVATENALDLSHVKKSPNLVKVKLENDPEMEKFKNWDGTLGALFGERDRLSVSEADRFSWDVAINNLIMLRNSCCRRNLNVGLIKDESHRNFPKWSMVPVEEHIMTVKMLIQVTNERDELKRKCKAGEKQNIALEQLEELCKSTVINERPRTYKGRISTSSRKRQSKPRK